MENKYIEKNGNIYIDEPKCFNLAHTFDCGQCFRWNKNENGYSGVAFGHYVNAENAGDGIVFKNMKADDFEKIWSSYFDFDTDYSAIQSWLSCDDVMKRAIPYGNGIRILRQEPFEALISFIISQNNNIPRIKLIVERLCERFGEKRKNGETEYFTFPSAKKLDGIEAGDLAPLKAGFRDKYIADAVSKVNSGEIDLEQIKGLKSDEAREALKQIKGVGDKVANCVMLFGLGKTEAFPVDVWIKRTVEKLYFDGGDAGDIAAFAKKKFANFGGFAQQYLFYYAREN